MPHKDVRGWVFLCSAVLLLAAAIALLAPGKAEFQSVSVSHLPDVSGRSPTRLSEKQWCEIPGIGKGLAGKIVRYKSVYGEFTSPDETILVDGIGKARRQAILEYAESFERSGNP